MKQDFQTSLLNSGDLMRKGKNFMISNIGKSVALITFIVAVLVSFTEIGICDFGTKEFTSTACLLMIASYLIFFSMEDAGEKLGKESEEYGIALKNYEEKKAMVSGDMIPSLREFLSIYKEEELAYRRKNLLFSMGLSVEEYEDYLKGKNKKERRKFRRVKHLKPIDITPNVILSKEKETRKSELQNPQKGKFLSLFVKMIPSTVCMLFTASIMLGTKSGMTVSDVVEALLKLAALPIFALRGYTQGYSYVKFNLVNWQNTKANLIEDFLSRKSKS